MASRGVQRIGALRDRIRIERRDVAAIGDGAGNVLENWFPVTGGRIKAQIQELAGDETVLAAKMQGHAMCLVMVRASSVTRSITPDDRIIDITNNRALNVRQAPPPDRRNYIALLCESGVADG